MSPLPVPRVVSAPLLASLLLSGVVVSASAASAADSPGASVMLERVSVSEQARSALVASWYQRFLGRPAAADPGSRWCVAQLEKRAPVDVVAQLLGTNEYRGSQIDGFYRDYLGREADAGSAYWRRGAFTLEQVAQNVLASRELREKRFRGDRYDVVTFWYISVLGRKGAPPSAQYYWVPRLEKEDPLAVLQAIYFAPEAVNHRLDVNFRDLLGRTPTQREREYWYPREVASDVIVLAELASTPEYLLANTR